MANKLGRKLARLVGGATALVQAQADTFKGFKAIFATLREKREDLVTEAVFDLYTALYQCNGWLAGDFKSAGRMYAALLGLPEDTATSGKDIHPDVKSEVNFATYVRTRSAWAISKGGKAKRKATRKLTLDKFAEQVKAGVAAFKPGKADAKVVKAIYYAVRDWAGAFPEPEAEPLPRTGTDG